MDIAVWKQILEQAIAKPDLSPKTQLTKVISSTQQAISDALSGSLAVSEFLTGLAKGPGTACPDSPVEELQKYVATRTGMIDTSNPAVAWNFAKKVMLPAADISRQIHLEMIEACAGDMTDFEKALFRHSCRIAQAVDELWLEWFLAVALPYQAFTGHEQEELKRKMAPLMHEFDYTVTVGNAKIPWRDAFPENQKIIRCISDLLDDPAFSNEKTAGHPTVKYFRVLRLAFKESNAQNSEELWSRVDKAWIEIPYTERLVPMHGIENDYEHPYGVSPDFTLYVRTDQSKETFAAYRQATPVVAEQLGADPQAVAKRLEFIDVGVFYSPIYSGPSHLALVAGKVAPNRQNILEQGGKIFVDIGSQKTLEGIYQKGLQTHCSPATAEKLLPFVAAEGFTENTTAHEFFHPVGCNPETNRVIKDVISLTEETKATLGGLLVTEYLDASREKKLELTAKMTARMVRFFHYSRYYDPSAANYVRECITICHLLKQAGVISLEEDGITVKTQKAATGEWLRWVEDFVRQVIDRYNRHDTQAIKELAGKYPGQDPFIREMLAWINRC